MSEFAVYLDDSGHPSDQPYVVVAGFLSTREKWVAFEPEWKVALQKYEVGRVFHMTDFERAKRKDRGTVLQALVDIILKHTEGLFCVIMEMDTYKRLNDLYALEETLGTPYAIACRAIATGINQWKAKFLKPADHLLLFIEDGTKHKGDMEEAFRRDSLPIPHTVPKSHPSVQPADLLAWEAFHHAKHDDRRRSLRNLLSSGFVWEGIFNERMLLRSCKIANVPLRKDVLSNVVFVHHSSPKRIRHRTIK